MIDSLKSARVSLVASLAFATALPTAHAADANDVGAPPLKFEITPFAGYRFGGRFDLTDTSTRVNAANHLSYGLAFDVDTDQSTQYELFYSRQPTHLSSPSFASADTTIEYLHLGGTLLFGEPRRFQPYVVGTVGATRFSPDSSISRDSLYFSLSLGAGVRVPFNEHLALRLEARGFVTFFNTNGALFCRSDQNGGVCALHGSGSTFVQGDALAGLAFTF